MNSGDELSSQDTATAAPLTPALAWIGAAGGVTMLAIGTLAAVRPDLAAQGYGVPVSSESDRAYMTAAGIRDLFVGGVVLAFSLLRDRRALGVALALGSGIAVGDGIIALRHGPDPKRVLPIHWGSAAVCVGLACTLLRSGRPVSQP